MRRPLLLIIAVALAGCGGKGASGPLPGPTPAKFQTYTDARFHFSFKYPSKWSLPKKGKFENINGRQTYVLTFNTHSSNASVELTLDHDVQPIPKVKFGVVKHTQQGQVYRYFNFPVAKRPALQGQLLGTNNAVLQVDTVWNNKGLSYDLRSAVGQPPFPKPITAAYQHVLGTITLRS